HRLHYSRHGQVAVPPRFHRSLSHRRTAPPTSTLFPYTTLFRSPVARVVHPADHDVRCDRDAAGGDGVLARAVPQVLAELPERVQDRKSTRLNSSHVESSYAVFCLKKKRVAVGSALPATGQGRSR